jgi:hypothetical protein
MSLSPSPSEFGAKTIKVLIKDPAEAPQKRSTRAKRS